jgi:prepilin-type N-terminal cleavage/methylation domain-containing protein
MKHRAYTLVEVLVVVMITALITVGLALSLSNGRGHAQFKQYQSDITNIIQQARTLSLANILITVSGVDYETDYYELAFAEDSVTLTAYGDSGAVSSEIDSVTFEESYGIALDAAQTIYYLPPYGEVCFTYSSGCDYTTDTDTSKDLVLARENSDQSVTFTVSIYSGYPEVN